MSRNVRLLIVLMGALVIQTVLVDSLPIFGVRLDLWIVLAVAGGLASGPDRGAVAGFCCGMLFDLTQNGPIGLGALIYTVAGYLVGSVQRSVVGSARWVPLLSATITTLVAISGYVALGVLLGEQAWLDPRMVTVILVVSGGAAVLTLPAVRIMAWTEGEPLGLPRTQRRSGSTSPTLRRSASPTSQPPIRR